MPAAFTCLRRSRLRVQGCAFKACGVQMPAAFKCLRRSNACGIQRPAAFMACGVQMPSAFKAAGSNACGVQ